MRIKREFVPVEKVVQVDEEMFVLTLTREEAMVLKAVVANTGGNPNGPRGVIETLGILLHDSGIPYYSGTESLWQKNRPHYFAHTTMEEFLKAHGDR